MAHDSSPSRSDRVALLADPVRRQLCAILTEPDPPVSERDLAVELAAWSREVPPAEITADQRRRQQIQLHHHHLPKLNDYGLVSYSRSTRTVSITAAGCEALSAATGRSRTPLAVLDSPRYKV